MTESDLCKVDDQDIGHLNQCYLDSGLLHMNIQGMKLV